MRPITFLFVAIPMLVTLGCSRPRMPPRSGVCTNRDIHELFSPDRAWKAIRFARGCGSGPDFVLQVSVLRASETLPNSPGNVLREEPATLSAQLQLVWEKPRELWVIRNYEMTVAYSVSQVEDVTIVHSTRKLTLD